MSKGFGYLIIPLSITIFFAGVIAGKGRYKQEEDMSKNGNMIEKVEVGLSYTINAGNYQSVRVHLGVTRYVDEGESTKDVVRGLRDEVRKELMIAGEEELAKFKEATSKRR